MPFTDLGRLLAAEHTERERQHLAATRETTEMHMAADEAEERGEHYTADLTRRAADSQQAEANRRWRPWAN